MISPGRDLDALRARLGAWLGAKLPGAGAPEISALGTPSAGLSNETVLFEASWRAAGVRHAGAFVLRLEPRGFQVFPEYDLARQYRVMERLHGSDVPVPRVRWLEEDTAVLGSAFYVMDRIEGEIPSEVPPYHSFGFVHAASPERRARLWLAGLEMLGRIHRIDWRRRGLDFLGVPAAGRGALDAQLDYYERYLEWVRGEEPQPILTAALRWLRDHRHEPRRIALCWGDSRLPNLMYRDDSVVGVLDWEMASLGDPETDLGWFLFLDWANGEGYGIPRLAGLPGREESVACYEKAAGWKVEHLDYHLALAALRFGVIMARVAARMKHEGVPTPSSDFARDNPCTRWLAGLLGMPAPGGERPLTDVASGVRRVQFHLTGAGGSDWYVVAGDGDVRRHEGIVAAADTVLTVAADDWQAIQAGTLDRTQAFLGGKLAVTGDLTLLMQLEEAISRLSGRRS